MHLYFRGVVHRKINRFHINLQYGQQRGLKALHFNPRFRPSQVVVLNSFRNGRWDLEERVHEMPFCKGESFEILFIVTAKGYQVNVNGRPFYTFKHRMPVKTVNAIKIAGDVSIETINITGGGQDGVQGYRGLRKMTITKIPHVGLIYGGLRTGTYMYFRGTIPHKIARFHINLNLGELKGCDKALHFNPRFKPSEVVVFNTFRNGRWDREERVNKMPFRRGEDFELLFIVTAHGFQVNINGRQFYLFKHRMPVEYVSGLKIAGDVSMKTVNMIRKIPHVGPVYGGLRTGMALFFRGTVPQEINRFHINLQSGELKGSDKALHFNPRFAGGEVVVFNTMRNGRWENEERPSEMPFRKGEDFELVFIITAEGYQVNVNGRQFYLFKHRMPVEQVSAIKIAGDVSMQTLNMTESIPFVGPIHGCLRTGMYMYFRGTVHQNINRFHINLQYGEKKGCDKALHFNPRFAGNGVIVFNSFQNGWKREERVHQMPFCKGEDFELVFIVTPVGYQVIVNGRPLYLFKHRMPVEHVSALKIAGDVSMEYVNLIGGGNRLAGLGKMAVTSIPHLGPILGGLRTGMFMFFRGTVSQAINRFHINLQLGEMKGCDKALHFNPRFKPSQVVVFNTFRNGRWEKEERVHEMPFTEGEEFELLFIITPVGYQVIVNGRQYYLFKHRMPLEHVSALKIAGDVSMEIVKLTGGEDDDQEGRPGFGRMVIPKIAHVGPIRRGLKYGMALQFQGTVLKDISRFHINLQYGRKDGCDLALHFNPRFKPYEVVVFNTFRKGRWEREERPKGMPFSKGEDFELVFYITSVGFQVYVNGAKFYLFKHRMPVENVNALKIAGDISMEAVDMTEEEPEEKPDGFCGGILEHPEILSVPYLEPISGGLRTGTSLLVKGTVPSNSYRFSINLYCGEEDGSDDAFHYNPRFDSNLVVFNTFRNGHWEQEERPSGMPFSKGEEFETVITATSDGYQVNVNGSEFHLFKHRMPLANVSAIKIVGDVTLHKVTFIEGGILEHPEILSVPYLEPISGGLRTGTSLLVKGTVPSNSYRFSINLYCGEEDGSDDAFHYNPRFDSNLVVFNTFRNGHWEQEERPSGMPFSKGEEFETVITATSDGYQVNVNGSEFHLFKHRIPLANVSVLKIVGDVTLHKVTFIGGGLGDIVICPGILIVPPICDLGPPIIAVPEVLPVKKVISYVGPIYGGLRPGMSVLFRGTVPQKINRFSINLYCEEKEGCDNAFHFNPRFHSNVVVFNTHRNGGWENEERPTGFPFCWGEDFEILYIITSEGYQVKVNGKEFHLYKHRMPVEQVRDIKIFGEVSMHTVNIIQGGRKGIPEQLSLGKMTFNTIPYHGPIHGGVRKGMYLYFRGTIHDDINRFHINLECGGKKGNRALHFNPRFKPSEVVVFNTFLNGRWGKEERVQEMPFHKRESFELVFFVTPKGYQVIVNGRRFYMYKHRLPVEHVNTLAIAGDVSMETLKMIGGGVQKYQGPRKILVTKIPHVGPVYGSLRTGMYVFFRGTVPQNINRFHINLQYGERKGSDIALHFNPRFTPSEVVVFNSFRNGRWENEERPSEMPFRKGEDFELVFFITAEGYQVNVNGRRFHFFKHRMPVETVGALSIAGDVSMKTVNMIGGGREGGQLHPSLGRIVVSKIPHVGPVYGGLRSGLYLYFKGTVPQEIKRFHINLQYGQMKGCDKALHFNPRFEPEEVVVFNSFRNGSWEQEERPAEMPFTKGEDFELVFIITSEGYQVNVNGRQFYLFKHRMPVEQVNAIKIAGEVSMETVNLTEGGQEEQPEQEDTVKIPHLRSVHGGLRSGTYLYFKGTIPQEIKRFHINLQYGEKKGCDKALHFNPRFEPEEVVVFNSFRNGSWEQEERPSEMPFTKGEDFELFIFVTAEGYQVNVNGRQYYLFKHRMPVEHVSAVKVVGDVSMKTANVIKRGPGAVEGKPDLGTMVVSKIPHVGSLFGGLRPGMYLYFRGTVPQEIERFHINLQFGKMKGCDKALHFNPRFKPEEVVVFNSFRNGGWENEERPTEMPFRKGEDFELVFFITAEGYQVYVNGRHFHLFNHRMPVEQVSAIKIVGDVSVQKLNTIKRVPGHRQPGFGQMAIRKIPHVGRLFGGLRPGMSLYFRGTVPKNINRFHINLQCGEKEGGDTAMHFNPRFAGNGVVVFNTFRNGKWEKEERPTEMPFREGEQFVLVFIVTSEGYQVNVNGREFYLFKHRIPLEHVSAIKIAGEVSIETGEITQGEEEEPEKEKEEKIVPSIPHVGPISGGLRPGMSLCFSGTIPEEANRFSINLHCGDEEGCDNAFHFNPRFEPSDVVVFNTFRNGSWENEERVEDMPFQPGDDFELVFVVTSEGYQVKVNDRKFYLFKHRMPMENVTTIRIFADVSIQTINIIEGGTGAMQGRLTQGKIVVDKMPFVEHLHHSLKTGMYMYFRGKVDDDINRFHINLQDGDMKGCAKALHFNPRFQPHEVVVFNTFQNGKWGKEERVNEMPFRKGEEFELVIIVTAKGYQVIVNGRRFYMFKHRLPVNQVSGLKIAGDVSMETIDMTEICLQGYQGRYKMAVTKIPHVSPVLGGLRPGMYLYFRGTVPEEINRFHINLQYGQGKGCDKALHFNPRFTPEEVVVFNSFRNGGWQHEERSSEMPFRKGEEFELLFIITSEGYQS
ncbi:uncharacterized protein LOC118209140 [Anguilla anguilla]|uniref:uncharacterized protein LOC118209140 n=1 Tax=Anguilla anguilla TaxID=7936 RepID=UPI0015B140BB|nr:uncharacterized protein LOC118209140 [Anguilla anguilla]